jgi:hypothetical protein
MLSQHYTHDEIPRSAPPADTDVHRAAILHTLRQLGADTYNLWLPETHTLSQLIGPDESIEGVVYGRYRQTGGRPPGRGVLVATDRRVIFLDRKPLFMNANEISYDVMSGVTRANTGFITSITLSTRAVDISIRTFNARCAASFVSAIEAHIFKRPADFRPIRI